MRCTASKYWHATSTERIIIDSLAHARSYDNALQFLFVQISPPSLHQTIGGGVRVSYLSKYITEISQQKTCTKQHCHRYYHTVTLSGYCDEDTQIRYMTDFCDVSCQSRIIHKIHAGIWSGMLRGSPLLGGWENSKFTITFNVLPCYCLI